MDCNILLRSEPHYFRLWDLDLACNEERVAGHFNYGSDLPPRSQPLFLLFPEGASWKTQVRDDMV